MNQFLREALADPAVTSIACVSAWANHRGLARIAPALRAFRARGGHTAAFVGIDEGGATVQGLRFVALEFDESWVVHFTDGRTFHPKVYLASAADTARIFVGSNNLTPGGMFFNFEAAVILDLDRANVDDRPLLEQVTRWIDGLLADTAACLPLRDNLDAVIADRSLNIRDEAEDRPRGDRPADAYGEGTEPARVRLFARSTQTFRPAEGPGEPLPGLTPGTVLTGQTGAAGRRRAVQAAVPAAGDQPIARYVRRMDATAAQHPPNPDSNPTGNLRLTQAGQPIDHRTYFRNELFGQLDWADTLTTRGVRQTATVEMDVVIDGRRLGPIDFDLSHAEWRIAGQDNVPTVLHWGELSVLLGGGDYTGRWLTIERWMDGTYRLTIAAAPTGPFVTP